MANKKLFGKLSSGEEVFEVSLKNSSGMEARVITLGAIIRSLFVPNPKGQIDDVVLGFSDLSKYEQGHPNFGTINGRIAGRVSNGTFTIEGTAYHLFQNDGPNHLHGGMNGMESKNWSIESLEANSVTLSYGSPDGENGYPGELKVSVSYTITDNNYLRVEYSGTTTKTTPVSLTNHSYFNLDGEGSGLVLGHDLQIFSEEYVSVDEHMTLSGKVSSLDNQSNDLREMTNLGHLIPQLYLNHGDNYLIDNPRRELKKVALLRSRKSGRAMEVYSDQQSLQLYTAKALDATLIGKSGIAYAPYSGVCLECQGYPDGVNSPEIEDILLRPDEQYKQITEYRFS